MKGKVRTEKGILFEVNIDEERFSKSVHGGVDCISCHINYKENPHQPPKDATRKAVSELADSIAHKAMVNPVAYASCVQCHEDAYKTVKASIHGKNIFEKKQKDGALCLDCHGSPHYILPGALRESMANKWEIVHTCGECHEREDIAKKYNLGTHIIEKYNESFHGKKHILGHPGAPTCIDCHGSHNIKKWDDPLSPVSWENRIETCGKCHPGSNKKFVAAITHKPMGKDNPIAYYGEKLLIILTISVFAFTVGHVILEAYAEIRDNVFRKRKEEPRE
ncbi:MAG: hypothetical protein HZC12_07860 [Nitrospirae bacterium]|nr:hypothetical protein [Nitrospirota bacterium]